MAFGILNHCLCMKFNESQARDHFHSLELLHLIHADFHPFLSQYDEELQGINLGFFHWH